jgi:putative CocE/NonD family hydrolase
MTDVLALPQAVECLDPVFVPMADGVRLAATIWRPVDAGTRPVPAIVEMIPYRRRDGTMFRDPRVCPYIAGHGFAYCRIDLRGSGDSDGILADEYLPDEQDDACAAIAWVAGQPWCTGSVGMTGLSWGGFNSLQVAARRPPALKAIMPLHCSDDRYGIDVHYMGGALLTEDPMWSSFMLAMNAMPPDPQIVGAAWRAMWAKRIEANTCWSETWLAHQRRDDYWRHGSVVEDYAAIQVPVYAVGGWDDSYVSFVLRLLAGLSTPRKGLIGPWSHHYPCLSSPGPLIDYLGEAIRWWTQWLKGEETGIMAEPMLHAWINDPDLPKPAYPVHPGRFVAEPVWPRPGLAPEVLFLNERALGPAPLPGVSMAVRSPATAGRECGRWGGYGGSTPDLALDQRREDGLALCFDTAPLVEDVDLLGEVVVELTGSVDTPRATLAARLCDVAPDGTSTLITFGVFNLCHRNGHDAPEALVPGESFRVRIPMRATGRRVARGHRLRLAIGTQFWPILWPQPDLPTLTVESGTSRLLLPVRPAHAADATVRDFGTPLTTPAAAETDLRPGSASRRVIQDIAEGTETIEQGLDYGTSRLEERGITSEAWCKDRFTIRHEDPLSARLSSDYFLGYQSGDANVEILAQVGLSADADAFDLDWRVTVKEAGRVSDDRNGRRRIARDHL